MRIASSWMAAASFLIMSSFGFAQEASAEASKLTAETAVEQPRKLETEKATPPAAEKKPVIYGGFITELSRAESKKAFLSLRQPRNPTNDFRNLYFDERSSRPKGFVLFSISFTDRDKPHRAR